MEKAKIFFVLGGPGSGKGTMCELLKKKYNFEHLSTGDLLRAEVKSNSILGQEANKYMIEGKMVPGDIPVKLIKNAIEEKKENNNLFIIDGYPRNKSNIEYWEKVIKNDVEIIGCLFLECSKKIMKDRILNRGKTSGRKDDNEEVFEKRIEVYLEETIPILEYFEKMDKLFKVSAEGSIEECFELCEEVVGKLDLEDLEKVREMKYYLKNNLDIYLEPLIAHVLKNRPDNVHKAIKEWIDGEGEKINGEVIQRDIDKEKSLHFV